MGQQGTVLHWNGVAWSGGSTATMGRAFAGLWGSGATDIWAVGTEGFIVHGPP